MTPIADTICYAWRSRRAWWFTATARTRARFARTLFGSFWLGISNLFSIGVLAIVYGTVFKIENFSTYVVFLGIGLTIWNGISMALGSAPTLFEHNANHLHNTNINPVFYTLEEWSFHVQTFLQSFILIVLALSFIQHSLILNFLWLSWLPLLNLFAFMFWVPLIICLLGARYRDFYQLVPIVLQLVFLLSPILYEKERLGPLMWTATFNPLYQILSSLRDCLIAGQLQWTPVLSGLLINIVGLLISLWLLEKERRHLPFLV
ncbi:ABC transporter permease [Synechococcus sp. RedBA-s]|uniref:ABC transporter permease n=1 Tax=Synechococcus sp. RedBA-s TaxID=2823741 RepID=UPI0020CC980F|nr:ABC transporter permease [Synechococcus sp. RedBA-s]MCP9799199.1 ABC transporter permease [Synechococcus sp. RedBA-s]